MKLSLVFLIAIGIAAIAAKPIDNEQTSDVSVVNEDEAEKREALPSKTDGLYLSILVIPM